MKPLNARRHLAASCSARARATWIGASVPEALLCLCLSGSLAEKQRRSWDVRMTWPAAVAVALGFASPAMRAAVWRPSRTMSVATRPGAPASGAHGHRDGVTKRATSTSDAPASGGRSPSQPPGQRMQARQQGAAAASASAGLGAAVAPLRAASGDRPHLTASSPDVPASLAQKFCRPKEFQTSGERPGTPRIFGCSSLRMRSQEKTETPVLWPAGRAPLDEVEPL